MKIFDKINENEDFVKTLNTFNLGIFYEIIFLFFSVFVIFLLKNTQFIVIISFLLIALNVLFFYLVLLKNSLKKILFTNQRIIYISKNNFLDYKEKEIYLEELCEFKIIKNWFLQNTFWFWDLELILNNSKITFKNIKNIDLEIEDIIKKIKK